MIAQYLEIKAANADSLLFYRMGDFYELFFEDAEIASRTLGIALTKRGKHLGQDIPMCGVPVHAADGYLQRLIGRGHRVAVCEQTEDPAEAKKRGAKAVVRRDVVRLVTPGTLTEESLLDARANNFLTALFAAPAGNGDRIYALASVDISTGELLVASVPTKDLSGELARLRPGEILLGDDLASDPGMRRLIEEAGAALTQIPRGQFDSARGERLLKSRLGVQALDAFGDFSRAELASLGGLLSYVELTQVGRAPLAATAAQRKRRQSAPHRCRDQSQSRAGALQPRRPRWEPARRHRSHRVGLRRARACREAGKSADRCHRAQCQARCRGLSRRAPASPPEIARGFTRGPDLARSLGRLALGPWRSPRSRRRARCD